MFYTFFQINIDGRFIRSPGHGICEIVIIEEENHEKAYKKLTTLRTQFEEERWNPIKIERGTFKPKINGQSPYYLKRELCRESCYIHLQSGKFGRVDFPRS